MKNIAKIALLIALFFGPALAAISNVVVLPDVTTVLAVGGPSYPNISIASVTYAGVGGSATYAWQDASCGSIDQVFWIRPTGKTGCYKMQGFAAQTAPGSAAFLGVGTGLSISSGNIINNSASVVGAVKSNGTGSYSQAASSDLSDGTHIPTSALNGGANASATTVWRGDGTWAAPPVRWNILAKSADYTVQAADIANGPLLIPVNATSGPITITVPPALGSAGSEPQIRILKTDTTFNTITISNGSVAVDYLTTPAGSNGQTNAWRDVLPYGTGIYTLGVG